MDNSEKKIAFNESLEYLVESANINNGTLTINEIKSTFDGIIDDDNMYELVYDYMVQKNIHVEGYTPSSHVQATDAYDEASHSTPDIPTNFNSADSTFTESAKDGVFSGVAKNDAFSGTDRDSTFSGRDKDGAFSGADKTSGNTFEHFSSGSKEHNIIEMYLSEIESSKKLNKSDELKLLQNYLSDHMNKDTVNLLTEINLSLVPPIADNFINKGVLYSDLLQEGNLGLIEGIMTFRGKDDLNAFHEHLTDAIRHAMNDAILEQNTSARIGSHAADRANELDRASVHLSKELDRTPTLEELSKYLALPEEEIEQIMKMSLNALTINDTINEE